MMLNAPYPADIRVKKESDALIAAGFEVHLLCLRKKGEEAEALFEGINVHRIHAGKNNYQLAFWDVLMSITFVHPRFLAAASGIIKSEGIRVVHIHDLPLCGTALKLKRSLGIKVVLDMHENYPEALRTWFKWKKNPLVRLKNQLFMNPTRWIRLEKIACEQSDRIIAVVDEMKARLVGDYALPADKITVVTNTEDKTFLSQKADGSIYGSLQGKFIIAYSGGIGPHRGVDVTIRAMALLKDEKDIQFAIVGFGSAAVMANLRTLAASLKLDNVHFLGYQPFSKFFAYMSQASVNVIPHLSNGHTDNTVPHKLFQGMMAGRPLLVSSSAPLKRYVESCRSGLVFRAGDDRDLAEKVRMLYKDTALSRQLGENGRRATIDGDLNWETTRQSLTSLYRTIVTS
jgi:glycosyltransferase involved in cell wall biosynthesis